MATKKPSGKPDLSELTRPVGKYLQRTSLAAFLRELEGLPRPGQPSQLVTIRSDATVGQALQVLSHARVLGAPVLSPETGEPAGFVDTMDVLKGLTCAVYPELLDERWVSAHRRLSMMELDAFGPNFSMCPVRDLLHDDDLWYGGDVCATLDDLLTQGLRIPPGARQLQQSAAERAAVRHRVGVFHVELGADTPDGPLLSWQVSRMVSQSDVVAVLAAHRHKFGRLFDTPVADLGLVQGVSCVAADTPALAAFAAMARAQYGGVGVTDGPAGPLVANLSASDLRGLLPERFGSLALAVGDYLALAHGLHGLSWTDVLAGTRPPGAEQHQWGRALAGAPRVTCRPQDTLAQAADAMLSQRVHRVYAVDGDMMPQGVITHTDILRLCLAGLAPTNPEP